MSFVRESILNPKKTLHIPWVIRPMEQRDDAAYRELIQLEPDQGWINISIHYKEAQSPWELLTQRREQSVFVAEVPQGQLDAGRVVGVGVCDPRRVWFEGVPVQAVHLHNLLVHPDFRHRGIATALIQQRIRYARQKYGANVLLFAEIYQDDPASFRATAMWATDFSQPRESGFLLARSRPPENKGGYTVREALETEYTLIAEGLNGFNHDVNFTRVVDTERLRRNLSPLNGRIFRHRYVVLEAGQIVGGAVLTEHDPSIETRVIRGRPLNQLIARLSGMIDEGGEVRYGEVDGIWFKPGHQNAEKYLIDTLLYKAKEDRATADALNFQVINPRVWEAVQLPRWQPHTLMCVAYLRPPEISPLPGIAIPPPWELTH
jgi:GNAT superfamily N-acetyltransferase